MSDRENLWRDIRAALGGLVAASLCIALVEMAGHGLFSGEAAFAPPLLGYALGAFLAAFVAARLAAHPKRIAIGIALTLAALAAFNLFVLPHPAWFTPAAALALALGCALGLAFRSRSDAIAS